MLGVIFYFSLFTVAGVACAHSLARAGCQLCLGVALFVLSSAVFIRLGVAPIFAPTLWLGLLAGSANFLAGQPLTMLVLGGQLLPILVAGVAWTPQGLAPLSAVLCVLLAGLACLAGSLLARGLSLR